MDRSGYASERDDADNKDAGCMYVLDNADGRRACGAPRQGTSPYCPRHHAVCYISSGSSEEIKRLREVEALASAVGGRRARKRAEPSCEFLKRLEKTVRGVL